MGCIEKARITLRFILHFIVMSLMDVWMKIFSPWRNTKETYWTWAK